MSATPRSLFGNWFARLTALLATAAVGFVGFLLWQTGQRLDAMQTTLAAADASLSELLGEVTRMRIEQTAVGKGPDALLERVRVYAPLIASSRTTEPDFQNAKKEMAAVLRAFGALGADALPAITARLDELKPDKDYDEVRFLLEAAVRVEPKVGKEMLAKVLQGLKLPSPRLRWFAAGKLIEIDKPLAQVMLRSIVTTESIHGVNPDRSAAGAPIPDPAAFATTGFNNFIQYYARSEDPKLEETLLMVMQRADHDRVTLQECAKVLGERQCAAAVKPIEKLYRNPPLQQDDPLFQGHMLNALVDIEGKAAKPFLEEMLPLASTEATSKLIQFLLDKIKE